MDTETSEDTFLPLQDFDFQLDLQRKLENIRDICSSMAMLLEVLTYNFNDQPSASELDYRYNAVSNTNLHKQRFFQSCLGISTLSGIITQVLGLRFSICRNLLILQQIVLSRCELFDSQSLHSIKSSLAPRTVVLTQAYYIVLWICTTNACITSSQALSDTCVQRLLTLKINVREPNIGHQLRPFSLVESFIQYCSRQHVYNIVSNPSINNENIIVWHSGILSLVTDIAQLIWPISGKFTFPQWLLSTCQFSLVQEYVRLLSSWCEWNGASRKFIAGISFLEMGEPYKACDYFLRASGGVLTDAYLSNIVFLPSAVNESKSLVQYYLKVIEIFEQHNAYDCILDIAMTAMSVTQKDDTNLLTLHSIIFAQHLNLQHHIQAYNCLETNPDIGRRVDCLRQLVITLFSRKKLTELVTFPYINMYYNMVKIMEARARSVDLMENNYYDFLYSFHMNKGNIRKAASIMYEQAIRLGQEPHSLLNISKQTRCLLACINALYLVKDDYRWIVKPTFGFNWIKEDFKLSKKRNINGNEIVQYKIKQQIEVLELKDIEREYVLSDGKLRLAKINPETRMTNQTCASEIVSIMSNLGLYYNALQVCQHYKLCSKAIFESLVSHCISFSINDGGKAWNWIYQNDIFDISVSYSNMADVAWNLLENLLIRFENIGESLLHKAIVMKLYHHGTFIPKWLHSSYTRLNAAEFLRLMIDNGRLEEASQFSLEYIQATIGKGNSQFLNKQSILSSTPHAHLPFNIIEMLLLELQSASENETIYLKMYESLSNAIKNYQKVVERTSKNIIQINLGGLKSNI